MSNFHAEEMEDLEGELEQANRHGGKLGRELTALRSQLKDMTEERDAALQAQRIMTISEHRESKSRIAEELKADACLSEARRWKCAHDWLVATHGDCKIEKDALKAALAAIHTLAVDAYDDGEDARHIEPMPTIARIIEESKS